jgi:spore coat polysaccharide biosynthesis predicted glycosyltransferase SpsG/CMP-N-acetylneuraminic acid synthetase
MGEEPVPGLDRDPICLIPARGTEPGLPKKHFKRLDGDPLLAHSITAARDCPALGEVYVTTEDPALAEVARDHGARAPFLRPERLASPDALLHEVVRHALDELAARGLAEPTPETPVVVLQGNVPFRRPSNVTSALAAVAAGAESAVSVRRERGLFWTAREGGDRLAPEFADRTVRDDLEPFYRETGGINVTTPAVLAEGRRVTDDPAYVVTDRIAALAVDSVFDLWLAERFAEGPRVVFRVDGGDDRGMGHVSRCLTLAADLSDLLRCEPTFVVGPDRDAAARAVRDAGFAVDAGPDPVDRVLGLDPDVVFLDVLDTDPDAVRRLHEATTAVINLEDRAGGADEADLVINALYPEPDGDNRYGGAEYVVLRDEFRGHDPSHPPRAERVLLTFGGSDPSNLSATVTRALLDRGLELDLRLVLGPDYDGHAALRDLPADPRDRVDVRHAVDDMGAQMAWADLAVAAGGRTVYELAATGTPTVAVAHNSREHERLRRLDREGVLVALGRSDGVDPARVADAVAALAADRDRRRRLSDRGRAYVDGDGADRILDVVYDVLVGD